MKFIKNKTQLCTMNKERVEPDEDLANVAYELSSNGRNTNLTTRLPGIKKFSKYGMF